MSDYNLRARLIRLAHAHPEFRADILPLVTATYESKRANAEEWESLFDKLDATFTSWNPNGWDNVYNLLQGKTKNAGGIAHWYNEYRAKRQTRREAIRAIQSIGAHAPKLAASKKA